MRLFRDPLVRNTAAWISLCLSVVACRSDSAKTPPLTAAPANSGALLAPASSGTQPTASSPEATLASGANSPRARASKLAQKLGRPHFLIGLGNDLDNDHDRDGAYTLGVTLDLHYAYLVGLPGQGGWPDWNPGGWFVNMLTDSAKRHGTVPMFTLYSMAAWGEANPAVLTNDDYMRPYWSGAKLLFERLGVFGEPAVVQFEPDWWGFLQQKSGNDPASVEVHVSALAPDCAQQPNNLIGMGKCLIVLARKYAPKTLIGFHASLWGHPDPAQVARFLNELGAGETDLVFTDMLDRDAGCFEAHTDPGCQRNDGPWYLDETNTKSPNFKEHLASVSTLVKTLNKPLMWWQVPLGVPSATPGGTAGHYRDNRVQYIFSHLQEFMDVGGVGAVFGVGAANQTTITTDGGQFQRAVQQYYRAPALL